MHRPICQDSAPIAGFYSKTVASIIKKYADEWEKRRVDEISDEQHRKLIAECFVGR